MKCYCNPKNSFEQCCQPLLTGETIAHTAEQLMRSRYSAYVLADINYLMKSHYSLTRPLRERKNILKWTKSVQWVGLEILTTKKGQVNDQDGYVEFKAFFMENGKMECIHENSLFIKEKEQWFYKSGTHK